MTLIVPRATVVGAPRQPLPYGLFSTFTLRPAGGRWEGGGVQFETLTCEPVDGIGAIDCDPQVTVGLPKNLDKNAGDVGEASPFTVYGHFNCSPMAYSVEEAQQKALEHLEAREQARAEQALWTGDLGNVPSLASGATTLNGGVAVSPAEALGMLEQWIGEEYGSLGVIHMTRGLVVLYDDQIVVQGTSLRTKLGTPVVAGAGYPGSSPAGAAAAAGNSWAYASPALFGYRSDVFYPSNEAGDLLDRSTNDLYAVAERTYLLGFDPCGTAAVLVDHSL